MARPRTRTQPCGRNDALTRLGEALGMSRQAAWEYFNRDVRDRLRRNVEANADLTDDEAMELAASEARAVRRRRRQPG